MFGRKLLRIAGPARPEAAREGLRLRVAGAGEGVHLASLEVRHLRDEVRRRAETVQADSPRVTGEAQRAVADEAGAEQRRCLDGDSVVGERQAVRRSRQCGLREPAIDRISRKSG